MRHSQDILNQMEEQIQKGYGQGAGITYTPWITVMNFSSKGRSHIVRGRTIPREYHLLSNLEENFFNTIDFMENIVDIREQYPLLPLIETLEISQELGLREYHPQFKGTPVVMTTDFLIDYIDREGSSKQAVRTIKPSSELQKKSVLAKFAIEEMYFRKHNIYDWQIVTERQINEAMAQDLADLKTYLNLETCAYFKGFNQEMIDILSEKLKEQLLAQNISVRQICLDFEQHYGLGSGLGLALYKYLLATKKLSIDFTSSNFGMDQPYNGDANDSSW